MATLSHCDLNLSPFTLVLAWMTVRDAVGCPVAPWAGNAPIPFRPGPRGAR